MAVGRLLIPIAEPILLSTGLPDVGATMTVFITGTGTLADLFGDAAGATPIANPQTSNSAGRFYDQSTEWFADDSQAYDVTLNLTDGETITISSVFVLGGSTNVTGFAPLNSPNFTGVPTAPTPATNDNSQKLATTAYVQAQAYAPINSPTFTGTPLAPTPASNDSSTKIATTAFVRTVAAGTSSFGTNGYDIQPSGYTRMWGYQPTSITGPNQTVSVSFPATFTTACYGASATLNNPTSANSIPNALLLVGAPTTSGAAFRSNGYQSGGYTSLPGFFWEAWGR